MTIAASQTPESLPTDVAADIQAIADAAASGIRVDPAIVSRIRERSERIRNSVFLRHGLQDIGVPAIRELRGDLPES